MTISVPLFAVKAKTHLGELAYRRKLMNNSQARLAGRYALEPEIDLGEFTCHAVIDWITIGFWLERETQFQWLQSDAEVVLGAKCFVEAWDERPGRVSDKFDIKVQEPDLRKVRELCSKLASKYGQHLLPFVRAIEISVDFTPKQPDDLSRAKLYAVLTRHIWTNQDVISTPRSRPRFWPSLGGKGMGHVLAYSPQRPKYVNEHHLISTEYDRAPFVDATYYVGAENEDTRWRIMEKVVDRQNRAAGTKVQLDDVDKRVRVEVTLDRPAVEVLGVTYLEDLPNLGFSRLQKKFFTFLLPTFQDVRKMGRSRQSVIQAWRDRQRIEKFSKTGVIGLKAMDDALERKMKQLRRRSQHNLSKEGLKLKPLPRIGDGVSGNLLAYQELNERIGIALRHLGERVASGLSTI